MGKRTCKICQNTLYFDIFLYVYVICLFSCIYTCYSYRVFLWITIILYLFYKTLPPYIIFFLDFTKYIAVLYIMHLYKIFIHTSRCVLTRVSFFFFHVQYITTCVLLVHCYYYYYTRLSCVYIIYIYERGNNQ